MAIDIEEIGTASTGVDYFKGDLTYMRFKTVFFDFDGTIMKTDPGVTKAMHVAAEKMGVEVPQEIGTYIGPPLEDMCRDTLKLTEEEGARFISLFRDYYRQYGLYECSPYPGILELISDLRKEGTLVYVATSKPEPMAIKILQHFGLEDAFDGITGASYDMSRSYKVDVLRYALQSRQIDPSSAAMVGDKDCDLHAARTLGCASVGVLYGYGARAEILGCEPDFWAEDVAQLRGILLG